MVSAAELVRNHEYDPNGVEYLAPRGRASTFDLTVPDSRDEDAYRPALEAAGFRVLFREPVFHEHRFARCDAPPANIHIWSPCRAPEGSAA